MNGLKMPHPDAAVNDFPLNIIHPIHEHDSGSPKAFTHALALAVASRGEIEIVDIKNTTDAFESLSVRAVLEKWGFLPPGAERSDVRKIGLKVTKIVRKGEPRKVIAGRMEKHPHDLLVIGTQERRGLSALFGRELAEYLADTFRQTTLYIPDRAKPFVDIETGKVTLNRILIPIRDAEFGAESFLFCRRLLSLFPDVHATILALHCGDRFPTLPQVATEAFPVQIILSDQPVVRSIMDAAATYDPDLIIMSTEGRNTLPKKVVGSNTEKVLREATCPVLSIAVA